jgi:hypothetical protein
VAVEIARCGPLADCDGSAELKLLVESLKKLSAFSPEPLALVMFAT